jgi:hypothetical protein
MASTRLETTMGILDEAIREHLELMRQHGAEGSDLQKIEDEAFGPPARPGEGESSATDAEAEAPTEFMAQPESAGPAAPAESAPAVEEHPAAEHATEAPEEAPPGPETEERMAIAEQPTELHDMEAELAPPEPATPEPTPSETDLLDAQAGEPRLESAQPAADDLDLSAAEAVPVDEDDDFFDEQSLSDELDQALEAPEGDEAPEPPAEEAELPPEPEPAAEDPPSEEQPAGPPDPAAESEESEEEAEEAPAGGGFYDQEGEDVLEETPEFLQDTPEHDRLWFEQKPPKDFDFED